MYLFIYKTIHKNGKYYIGRHQTNNLNDGYLGSGKWVKSIKDKNNLSKEIICKVSSFDELKKLEEYYIDLYWNDPLCMNYKRASSGWNSKDVSEFNKIIQENGKSISQNRATNMYNIGKSGLKSEDGRNIVYKMTEDGKNSFSKRPDGTSVASDLVKSGKHNLVGGVTCVNKNGKIVQIPKDQYKNQKGEQKFWEYVSVASNEGRKRRGKPSIILVSCINREGKISRIDKKLYDSQPNDVNSEWVFLHSKEGKLRKQLKMI